MGKGSTIIKKLNPTKKYHNVKIEDSRFPDRNFVIVPLHGWGDTDRFFYLCMKEEGLEIMGEGYLTSKKEASALGRDETKDMIHPKFHITDAKGSSLKYSEAKTFLANLLGDKYSDDYLHNEPPKDTFSG